MVFNGLWDELTIIEQQKMDVIRKDWTEGKVPDLPFVIIDQQGLKQHIGEKLQTIDGERMTTTVVKAQYGDGKTNVLKYLSLYFETHADLGVHLLYCRADVDQTDISLFLLQHLQNNSVDALINGVKSLREVEGFNLGTLANNFKDDFSSIREYTEKLFNLEQDDETVRNLIYLGTGRLYSIGAFQKYGLSKLTDFNRKEVLVLFLNILARTGYRVVFAIDELEKIYDKSTRRMAYFFNSYRELVDLFNKIHGHYLITTMTQAIDIALLSQPLWGRIEQDVVEVSKIRKKEDLADMVKLMARLLNVEVGDAKVDDVVSTVLRKNVDSNRFAIRAIAEALHEKELLSLDEEIKKDAEVAELYQKIYTAEKEHGFKNLSQILFDPLQYYLEALGYENVDDNLSRRDNQAFVDPVSKRAFFFLFNDDSKIKGRVQTYMEERGIKRFVIFVPNELTVTHAMFDMESVEVKLIDYDPKQLFVLLDAYRKNFDMQDKLFRLIGIATQNVFE